MSLLAQRLAWEKAHPRPESLVKAERAIVCGLRDAGLGNQYQVTTRDGFEIAVGDLTITVRREDES